LTRASRSPDGRLLAPLWPESRGGARPLPSWAPVVLLALAAPWISPGSPFRLAGKPLSPPFGEYLFGTDTLGRDVAAGITHGARTHS